MIHTLTALGGMQVAPHHLAAQAGRDVLRDLRPVMAGNSALPLAAIDDSRPEGKRLLAAARQLLNFLNKPGVEEIDALDVTGTETLLQQSNLPLFSLRSSGLYLGLNAHW